MLKINPLDIIQLTSDIHATIQISRKVPYTEMVDIVLPKGSLLISNTNNYFETTSLSFVDKNLEKFKSLANLYLKYNHTNDVEITGYNYIIDSSDLSNNYKLIKKFEYEALKPTSQAHIFLMGYLILDNKTNLLNASKLQSFITDWTPLEETKKNYDLGYLTSNETHNILVDILYKQLKLKNQ